MTAKTIKIARIRNAIHDTIAKLGTDESWFEEITEAYREMPDDVKQEIRECVLLGKLANNKYAIASLKQLAKEYE